MSPNESAPSQDACPETLLETQADGGSSVEAAAGIAEQGVAPASAHTSGHISGHTSGQAAALVPGQQESAPLPLATPPDSGLDAEALWDRVQAALRKRIEPEQFETWFRHARLVEDGSRVSLAVLNPYSRDWVRKYYGSVVDGAVQAALGRKCSVEVVVDPEATVPQAEPRRPREEPTPLPASPSVFDRPRSGAPSISETPQDSVLPGGGLLWNSDVVLNRKYTFENFVVGPCNRFAHAAAMGAGESPGRNYNPFFLHGRVGVGKTHLLQAVCFSILSRWPRSRILYFSCETFLNHFISALENGDLTEFRNKYRNVDVLVVDDIHILANKERTQEEFFHTFNTLYQAGKQIVLSSDSPPKDIPTLQERLVSRFKWGMVTEIEPPCYETRMAIVKRKSRDQGRELPDPLAQLIAEQIDQNVRELEGAVTRLLGFSSLTGQPLTMEVAREALGDLLQVRHGAPSMDDIIAVVTGQFAVKLSELQSKKRTKAITYPRQIAMFLARKITRHSLEEIGGFFGGRDHSTVIYAIDRISQGVRSDPAVRQLLEELLSRLGSRAEVLE